MSDEEERDELRRRWVEALESGEYAQGLGCLRNGDGQFCCLGVLCDLVGEPWVSHVESGWYSFDGSRVQLTHVLKKVGISVDMARELANMNDSGSSFREIADHIRLAFEMEPVQDLPAEDASEELVDEHEASEVLARLKTGTEERVPFRRRTRRRED